jgi:hypothetical protein
MGLRYNVVYPIRGMLYALIARRRYTHGYIGTRAGCGWQRIETAMIEFGVSKLDTKTDEPFAVRVSRAVPDPVRCYVLLYYRVVTRVYTRLDDDTRRNG